MLVVGRVQVHDVGRESPGRFDGVEARRRALAIDQFGQAQTQGVQRTRRPGLQVRHLHADRGIDAVGGFDETGERDGLELGLQRQRGDARADRFDTRTVLGAQITRAHAVGVREPAGLAGQGIQLGEHALGRAAPARTVGRHVAAREHVGVGVVVVGVHAQPGALHGLADARGAREQVHGGARAAGGEHRQQLRHEQPLGTQVLDHGDLHVSGDVSTRG